MVHILDIEELGVYLCMGSVLKQIIEHLEKK